MTVEQERKDVEFKTFDGLTLRGSLYVGPKGGPAVIVNGAASPPLLAKSTAQRCLLT